MTGYFFFASLPFEEQTIGFMIVVEEEKTTNKRGWTQIKTVMLHDVREVPRSGQP